MKKAISAFIVALGLLATPTLAQAGGHGWGHHHWGGHGWGHWRGGPWWGPSPFWYGLGAGVLGAYLVDRSLANRPAPGPAPQMYGADPNATCAQTYKSYDPNTGLFTSKTGEKKMCPYLK